MSDTADYKKYLQPELVSKLKSIELKAKLIVEGFITGLHKSPYHGFSVEFAEHRQYAFGDEPKYIDWKAYARTDKYFIKQFEEETNLRSLILLDASSSMCYRSSEKLVSKIEYGSYLAAALAYMMLLQRDATGLIVYDESIKSYYPPRLKESHFRLLLQTLEKSSKQTSGVKTNAEAAFRQVSERLDKRGLIIVISDFLEAGQERIISLLKNFRHKKNEVIVFQVLDPAERFLNFDTDAELTDIETGEKIMTNPPQIRSLYQEAVAKFTDKYERDLKSDGIDYTLLDTSEPFDVALLSYLKRRSVLK
jgi:uncharacterized protein (DUF58 family)